MNLPGTSAHASPHHHISRVSLLSSFPISLLPISPISERPHSHHRTPSRSPLCYARSSPPPSSLHDCTPHITPLSPFPNFTTSNLPTLYTISVYLHFELPNKTIPFPFRSYPLSLNVLFSFSLIFAPSASLWALLPTIRTRYLFYTCNVTYLYALRHPFVRTSSVAYLYLLG